MVTVMGTRGMGPKDDLLRARIEGGEGRNEKEKHSLVRHRLFGRASVFRSSFWVTRR